MQHSQGENGNAYSKITLHIVGCTELASTFAEKHFASLWLQCIKFINLVQFSYETVVLLQWSHGNTGGINSFNAEIKTCNSDLFERNVLNKFIASSVTLRNIFIPNVNMAKKSFQQHLTACVQCLWMTKSTVMKSQIWLQSDQSRKNRLSYRHRCCFEDQTFIVIRWR